MRRSPRPRSRGKAGRLAGRLDGRDAGEASRLPSRLGRAGAAGPTGRAPRGAADPPSLGLPPPLKLGRAGRRNELFGFLIIM